ncbi:MAG: hypothetical protein AB1632_03275 [Nitrospirota bacterium]
MRNILFTLFLVLVMLGSGYASDKDKPPADYQVPIAERPTLNKGDRWDYERRGKIISYEFIEEKNGQLVFQIQWDDGTKETEICTPDLNYLRILNAKGEILEEYTPFRGQLNFPLWVGKKWSYTFTTSETRRAASESKERDSNVKVVAYEQVKVPAGTFWAFKIEEERHVRGKKGPKAVLGSHITMWYSPDIKRYVKTEHENETHNRDLIKYTPAK